MTDDVGKGDHKAVVIEFEVVEVIATDLLGCVVILVERESCAIRGCLGKEFQLHVLCQFQVLFDEFLGDHVFVQLGVFDRYARLVRHADKDL